MDNLTHSLIGLVAGEVLARVVPARSSTLRCETRRSVFITATVVGGNLPDADLLYSYRGLSTDKLTYLLEHRGYTHTVIGCFILALLLYAAIASWMSRRRIVASRADHLALAGVALVGTGLHLLMDSLNSYGVHPFWPMNDGWIYGDSVFIVEPLFWAATAPLLFTARSKGAKVFLTVVLAAAALTAIASGRVATIAWLALVVIIASLLAVGRLASGRSAVFASGIACMLVTLGFIVAGQVAARRVESVSASEFPGALLIDHVLTPLPANPLCWDALILQTLDGQYIARHTIIALAPGLLPADRCKGVNVEHSWLTPRSPDTLRSSTSTAWTEFAMPIRTLARLSASHCEAAALMRFARAPFAVRTGDGWLMGDLRFDQQRKPGIADIALTDDAASRAPCPWTPPWVPPHEDLLKIPP